MHTHTYLSCLVVISLTLALGGCSEGPYGEGVDTGTVKGTITYNGNPIPEGCLVTFLSEGGTGVPAGGAVGSDGSFTLRAKGTLDIPTGLYKVTVAPPVQAEMTAEQAMEASVAGTLESNEVKGIPEKYRSPETTPEVFEVKAGDNSYTLDMKD